MLRCFVHSSLFLLSKLMSLFYFPFLLYYKCKRPQKCPEIRDEIYFTPAIHLAEKIRRQEIRSAYVVEAYITRAKEVNLILNAIVEDRFDLALEEARQVDEFITNCSLNNQEIAERYPLLGVPMSIKESVAVFEMSNNAGRKSSLLRKAPSDADCVRQLEAAGAIIILVSNTPEMCLNWETVNYVTGRTLNPYDTRRTCGGSSGGEAVLLATCGSLLGVGSDIVGSVRLPPAFCGVYGHKPTPGLISQNGHYPTSSEEEAECWKLYFTFGPLSRYALDLALLLDIMVIPEKKSILGNFKESDVKKLKIFYMDGNGENFLTTNVDDEIVCAIHKVVKHLRSEGFETEKISSKLMSDSIDLCFIPLLTIKYPQSFSYGDRSVLAEMLRTIFCCPNVVPTAILFVWMNFFFKHLASQELIKNNLNLLEELKGKILEFLGEDGVLIYPAFPTTAHFHGRIYSKTIDTSYLGIFTTLGLPVTICPIGMSSEGLPISMQVISKPNNDKHCLALARELERTYGGWIPPPYVHKNYA